MILRFACLCIGLMLTSCADFDDPEPQNLEAILGCYGDVSGEKVDIQIDGLRGLGMETPVPYKYEQHKIGVILAAPVVAIEREGNFTLEPGDTHFYRVQWSDGRPWLKIAFAPDAIVRDYPRVSKQPCT